MIPSLQSYFCTAFIRPIFLPESYRPNPGPPCVFAIFTTRRKLPLKSASEEFFKKYHFIKFCCHFLYFTLGISLQHDQVQQFKQLRSSLLARLTIFIKSLRALSAFNSLVYLYRTFLLTTFFQVLFLPLRHRKFYTTSLVFLSKAFEQVLASHHAPPE